MKKILGFFKVHPIMIFFVIMCIFYLPSALVMEPESVKKAFVTAIAIDKVGDEIETSAAMVVPIANVTSTEKIKIISSRGNTINTCLSKMSLHIGKELELAHTNLVIVNLNLAQNENMAENLNFLITNTIISNGTEMIATNGNAKELLNASLNMFNSIGIKIYQLLSLNEKYMYAIDSTIGSFYQGYLGKNQVSFLNIVDLKEQDYDGIVAGEGGASANDDSGGEKSSTNSGTSIEKDTSKKVVSNNGETAVFKNGEYITTLLPLETKAINYLNTKARNDYVEIDNINDKNLVNGKMTLKNLFKRVGTKTKFENSKPVVEFNIDLALRIDEIYEENSTINELVGDKMFFTKEVQKKIEEEIKKSFIEVIKKSREYDIDLLSIYDNFDIFNHKDFEIYLKTLSGEESFYDNVIYKINVNKIYVN